jgi:RNA polymerase sigma-70 factor (ECF subfamily)
LLRYLSVMAPGAAEDLARDVWIEVVRQLAKFRGGEPEFRTWLFTMAHRRATSRRRHRASPAGDTAYPGWPAVGDAPATAAGENPAYAALALIATLPPEQAEVIVLRVVAGLTIKETAEVTGKRPGAVQDAARQGLRTLEARLTGAPAPDPWDRDDRGGVTR